MGSAIDTTGVTAAAADAGEVSGLDLYSDIQNGWLPAFSIVKPSGLVDGHPASSKLDLFEGFSKKIVDLIKAQPELWKDTAIVITFDEGGGYYDSGYVQPLDFFGDGTRIPAIVVSPWATGAGSLAEAGAACFCVVLAALTALTRLSIGMAAAASAAASPREEPPDEPP